MADTPALARQANAKPGLELAPDERDGRASVEVIRSAIAADPDRARWEVDTSHLRAVLSLVDTLDAEDTERRGDDA